MWTGKTVSHQQNLLKPELGRTLPPLHATTTTSLHMPPQIKSSLKLSIFPSLRFKHLLINPFQYQSCTQGFNILYIQRQVAYQ